jgi:hypothetical protein
MFPRISKVYICPRGIPVHRSDRNRCGQACMKTRNDDNDDVYEEGNYIEVVSMRGKVEFDASACKLN